MTSGKQLYGTLIGIIAVLSAVAIIFVVRAPAVSSQTTKEPWPAMTLTYEVEGRTGGLTAASVTQTWKLVYQDQHHWRKELLASPTHPEEVGTVISMQGDTMTEYLAPLKKTVTKQDTSGVPTIPEEWLAPGRDQVFASKGYTKSAGKVANQDVYQKKETVACQAETANAPVPSTGILQPSSCTSAATYERTETLVYRSDLHVPVEVTNQTGGVVTRHVMVTQLTMP